MAIERRNINPDGTAFQKVVIATDGTDKTPATSPTITSGAGAPSATEPNGSLYFRTDGGASTTLYVRHTGAWLAK